MALKHNPFADPPKLRRRPSVDDAIRELDAALSANKTQTKHKLDTERAGGVAASDTNLTQTQHVSDTDQTQTEYEVATELTHNWNEPDTKSTQTSHKPNTEVTQTSHKLDTVPDTSLTPISHVSNTKQVFADCTGAQRTLMIFVFDECVRSKGRVTGRLTFDYVCNATKLNAGSVRTSICRLTEKGLLERPTYKNGRGGWTRYGLNDQVYTDILHCADRLELNTNITPTSHKPDTPRDHSSSSSINKLNLKPTTPELWTAEDVDMCNTEPHGLTRQHIQQLAHPRYGITLQRIQESIMCFDWDMNQSKDRPHYDNPLKVFMAAMKRYGGYATEDLYYIQARQSREQFFKRIETE